MQHVKDLFVTQFSSVICCP